MITNMMCCDVQESGSWQEILRALCALEAVISQGSSAACGEIAVHFQVSLNWHCPHQRDSYIMSLLRICTAAVTCCFHCMHACTDAVPCVYQTELIWFCLCLHKSLHVHTSVHSSQSRCAYACPTSTPRQVKLVLQLDCYVCGSGQAAE